MIEITPKLINEAAVILAKLESNFLDLTQINQFLIDIVALSGATQKKKKKKVDTSKLAANLIAKRNKNLFK